MAKTTFHSLYVVIHFPKAFIQTIEHIFHAANLDQEEVNEDYNAAEALCRLLPPKLSRFLC